MPMEPSPGDINIRLSSSGEGTFSKPAADAPFRMAVMGDFTGRMNRNVAASLQDRRPVRIDRDEYEAVLARLSPELHLAFEEAGDAAVHIRVREPDDFHPDRLFETLPVFQELRQTLKDLDDPRRFEHAAARISGWTGPETPRQVAADPEPEQAEPPEKTLPIEAGEGESPGILDRIIDEAQGDTRTPASVAGRSDWDRFLNRIAAPHRVAAEDPRRAELKTVVSEMISEIMRRILHHPDFQRLESVWRGVRQLVSDLETDEFLSIYLIDVSKAELAADLTGSEGDAGTGIYRLLVREAVGVPGAVPWAVAAGCYTFGSPEDVAVLARMARIAAVAGAPFLSGADSHFIGCASIVETPDPDDWSPEAGAPGCAPGAPETARSRHTSAWRCRDFCCGRPTEKEQTRRTDSTSRRWGKRLPTKTTCGGMRRFSVPASWDGPLPGTAGIFAPTGTWKFRGFPPCLQTRRRGGRQTLRRGAAERARRF